MKGRSWRQGRARNKPTPIWQRSLFVYNVGACVATVAAVAVLAFAEPWWLALVVWFGGLFVFVIVSMVMDAILLNRRVLRYLADGRTSAACAALATSMSLSDKEKQERIKQLREAKDDVLPPYDPRQALALPRIGVLGFLGIAIWRGVAGDPLFEAANLALLAGFGGAILDALIHRAIGRGRVRALLGVERYEEATRMAHRYEIGALRTFAFSELFEAHGQSRYRNVVDGLPANPWIAITSFVVAAVSRLAGLPPWLAFSVTLLSVIGTVNMVSAATRARIWMRLDELEEHRRFKEADALADRVKTTHGISFEEE